MRRTHQGNPTSTWKENNARPNLDEKSKKALASKSLMKKDPTIKGEPAEKSLGRATGDAKEMYKMSFSKELQGAMKR